MQTEAENDPIIPADQGPVRPRRRIAILRFGVLAASASIVWIVTWLAIAGSFGIPTMTANFIIPSACVVLFGLIVLRQEQKWVWPLKRMEFLLPQIRAGELPIDSLNEIEGGSKELAAQVRAILRDLRRQRTRIAEMDVEMQQRVANRTDALERTIGSLRQQATRDPLTGLFNRRMLDQFLPVELEKCRGDRTNLAVLMIDVDHFKGLNDTLGHASGDQLLRDISQLIRSSLRDTDAAFRNGGDEFVVVLPNRNETEAQTLAARITSLVDGLTRTLKVVQKPGVSIGISTLGGLPDATAHTLLECADRRLYESKSARRPQFARAS